MKRLDPVIYVADYISNGRNGTKAVQAQQPELSDNVAANKSSRMLSTAKVRALLDGASESAAETMLELMKTGKENTRIAAAKDILDRTGHTPVRKTISASVSIEQALSLLE